MTFYKDDLGKELEITDVPSEMKDSLAKARTELIERLAEVDDPIMENSLAAKTYPLKS